MKPLAKVFALALTFGTTAAGAATIDLTTAGATGTAANGTIYTQASIKSGTGIFGPFLRVNATGNNAPIEQGYNGNFSGNQLPWDTVGGAWTRPLKVSDLVHTTVNGTGYYEFLLDINEPNPDNRRYIYLDSVRIWASDAPRSTNYAVNGLPAFGTPLYDMDSAGDVTVKLDGNNLLDSGSGRSDMAMYIRATAFTGLTPNQYLTFYSRFSGPDGGFEEWSTRDRLPSNSTVVPLPPTAGLLLAGALALGLARRKSAVAGPI